MAIPNITNFISHMDSHAGIAKQERYYCQIFPPVGVTAITRGLVADLRFQCETTELPGTTMETTDYRFIGPSRKMAISTAYTDITLSFYCTNDFYEKPFFDLWLEYINPRNLGWDFRYKDEYAGSLELAQVDMSGDNIVYAVRLVKAFPTSITAMGLNWSGDAAHILAVTFAYDRIEPILTFNNIFNEVLNLETPDNNGLNAPLTTR